LGGVGGRGKGGEVKEEGKFVFKGVGCFAAIAIFFGTLPASSPHLSSLLSFRDVGGKLICHLGCLSLLRSCRFSGPKRGDKRADDAEMPRLLIGKQWRSTSFSSLVFDFTGIEEEKLGRPPLL